MRPGVRLARASLCLAGACLSGELWAQPPVQFDEHTLRLRGIDPQLATYLAEAPRYAPGPQWVALAVNGQPRGRALVQFDGQGQLCLDAALADAAGLRAEAAAEAAAVQGCEPLSERYPLALVELRPALGEVELQVPDSALEPLLGSVPRFQNGGVAGLFNYDVQALHSQFDGYRSQFWALNSQVGFNAGNWIVRSRQLHSQNNGQAHTQHVDAYAQRAFAEWQATLQAGQINLANPVLAGARITGVQWASEPLLRSTGGGPRIREIALTQARVEVRQSGVLLYSTVVPEGPFELQAVPDLDPRRDVQLTVIEADGQRREVQVPSSALGADLASEGFVLGAGMLRDTQGGPDAWVMGGGWSQPLWPAANLASGALLADGYRALGAGLGWQAWPGGQLQASQEWSASDLERVQGAQARLSLGQQLGAQWQLSASLARQTPGYRHINDRQLEPQQPLLARFTQQYSLGLSWAAPQLGSLSAGYSAVQRLDAEQGRSAYLTWARQFGQVTLNANAQWQLGSQQGLGNALYLSASLPWGERRRLRASQRSGGGQQRFGLNLQEQLNERLGYSLGAEHAQRGGKAITDVNASLALLQRMAQVDAAVATQGPGNRSYALGLRGGVALHEAGLSFSPYPLQDTFALLKVGDVPGVQVDTPGGPVWTDRHGRAVIAQMSPYRPSHIEVQTRSLPRNVDLRQGAAQLQLSRGAVARLQFDTRVTRRVLLRAVDAAGTALAAGMLVLGEEGGLVSLVQEGGVIFVADLLQTPRLRVRLNDQQVCELQFQLAAEADLQAYFESVPAVCRLT